MEVEIVKIQRCDAFYENRKELIGMRGRLTRLDISNCGIAGFVSCDIVPNNKKIIRRILESKTEDEIVFYAVMLKAVE